MIIVSKSLRYLRAIFRTLESIFVQVRFEVSLLLNNVEHKSITINGMPYIAVVQGGKCIFGNNLSLNSGLRFNPIGYPQPCSIVVTKGAVLKIGCNVGLSQASIICHHSITIEDNVKIGGGVKVYDTNFHTLNPDIRRNHEQDMANKKVAPVVIKHDAFIGAGSIILPGLTIGANSIVGAGSVVTKNIPDNQIWGGNPAKYIKDVPYE